MLDTAMFFVCF